MDIARLKKQVDVRISDCSQTKVRERVTFGCVYDKKVLVAIS